MPSMVQIAVGAAMTSLSEPALASGGFWVVGTVADVIVSTSIALCERRYELSPLTAYQRPAKILSTRRETMAHEMDPGFGEAVREMLTVLASGGEPGLPAGGGLTRVFRETGATTPRAAVEALVDRWFRAAPAEGGDEPPLNRPELGESEKLHAALREHVVGQRRWQELSHNESTFYRYRRAAIGAFAERLWGEIVDR